MRKLRQCVAMRKYSINSRRRKKAMKAVALILISYNNENYKQPLSSFSNISPSQQCNNNLRGTLK